MTEREQIEQLQQNRHLIAGGVYTAATVDEVAGWIQTTCELAMRVISCGDVHYTQPPIIDLTRRRVVAAAPLPADMPRVEIIEDDGETA